MTAHERWMRHLRDAIVQTIAGIPAAQREDVYVIHLTLESEDDDSRRVIATVAWNTIQHLRAKQAHAAAKRRLRFEWFSYSFAEPRARVIGERDEDVELRTQWLREAGLWYEDAAPGSCAHRPGRGHLGWLRVDGRGHRAGAPRPDGTFERFLGKEVPVLLDTDLGREDGLRVLNRRANPARFYPELDRWSQRGLADA